MPGRPIRRAPAAATPDRRPSRRSAALAADSPSLAVLAIRPHLVWGPGDPQLVDRIVERARAGRLPVIGSGAALIDTTYVDNAAAALIAAVDACGPVHGEALVVSNGEPRPVAEVLARLCRAAGVPGRTSACRSPPPGSPVPRRKECGRRPAVGRFPRSPASWRSSSATAHWFDQRRTRSALRWQPAVNLDEGFRRLSDWYGRHGG